jgi:hypothetical protein
MSSSLKFNAFDNCQKHKWWICIAVSLSPWHVVVMVSRMFGNTHRLDEKYNPIVYTDNHQVLTTYVIVVPWWDAIWNHINEQSNISNSRLFIISGYSIGLVWQKLHASYDDIAIFHTFCIHCFVHHNSILLHNFQISWPILILFGTSV